MTATMSDRMRLLQPHHAGTGAPRISALRNAAHLEAIMMVCSFGRWTKAYMSTARLLTDLHSPLISAWGTGRPSAGAPSALLRRTICLQHRVVQPILDCQ